jgi:hypothetical protein
VKKINHNPTINFILACVFVISKNFVSIKPIARIFLLLILVLNSEPAKSQSWYYQHVDDLRNQLNSKTIPFRVGIYQVTKDSKPLQVDGQSIYYLLNAKGVILIGMGKSTKIAFYDISGGLKSGRINSGTYVYDSTLETFNFKIGKENTKSSWKYINTEGSIRKNSDNLTKLVFVESI